MKKEHIKKLFSEAHKEGEEWYGIVMEWNLTTRRYQSLHTTKKFDEEEHAHLACEKWAQDRNLIINRATDEE